ncbi:uncharacterized protein LOC143918561 [Arctopsyche grandis]|uniref:uncharacterized protein LOC143918561 n=1 Tax=Arctopsyche grandis TaxID=121162 RepID=UPI00406D8FA0
MESEVLGRNGRRSRAGSQGGSQERSRRREWRGSSSEDEAPRMDPHVFASLLAQAHQQYTGDHRSYRSDCEEGPGGAPGPPRSPRSPQLRQSSPFPVESTNRRLHYGATQDRLRPVNGEIIYATANPKKLPSSSSLSRSGRAVGRRSRGLTPSSSASSGLEGPALRAAEPYVLDQDPRLAGICMNHDPGEDSPPEPAPPEVPPRGPSLRRSGGPPIPPQALEAVPNCNFYNQVVLIPLAFLEWSQRTVFRFDIKIAWLSDIARISPGYRLWKLAVLDHHY